MGQFPGLVLSHSSANLLLYFLIISVKRLARVNVTVITSTDTMAFKERGNESLIPNIRDNTQLELLIIKDRDLFSQMQDSNSQNALGLQDTVARRYS